MDGLKDKVVILTGSSSGIGASAAVEFARHGAKVTLTGRSESGLRKTAAECSKVGAGADKILLVTGDIKVEADLQNIVDKTIETFGQLDVLVNNAGISLCRCIQEMTMAEFDELFQVDVRGVVYLTRLCIPHLKKTKGNIINISSAAGIFGSAYIAGYSMAKAAVNMFTRVLSVELGRAGIRVNCICPGDINTPMINRIGVEDAGEYCEQMRRFYPLDRVGQPVEVSKVIVFLASEAASFMTGCILPVDGGVSSASVFTTEELADASAALAEDDAAVSSP